MNKQLGMTAVAVVVSLGVCMGADTAARAPLSPAKPGLSIEKWIAADAGLDGVCLSPDGTRLYVAYWANGKGRSPVVEYDVVTSSQLRTFDFDDSHCHGGLVISPDGRYLYTPNYYYGHATRINLQTGKQKQAGVGGNPCAVWAGAIDMTPDGSIVAVSLGRDGRNYDMDNDQISIMNAAGKKFKLVGEVTLPDEPRGHNVVFTRDGTRGYVVTHPRKSPQARVYEISMLPPYRVTRILDVPGGDLGGVAVCDNANKLYVSDRAAKKIHVVALNNFTIVGAINLEGSAPETMAVTRDGARLLALTPATRTLWAIDTGTDQVLTSMKGLRRDPTDMAITPDGTHVFVTHRGQDGGICMVRLGEETALPVTNAVQAVAGATNQPAASYAACATPAAQKFDVGTIVFTSDMDGNYQLYKMDKQGVITRLTHNNATESSPRWSPDGQSIAFISDREGPARVFIMNSDGTDARSLKDTDPVLDQSDTVPLDWSGDGTRLAFASADRTAIRIVNRDGSGIRTVVKGRISHGYASYSGVCWRNAEQILFSVSNPSWGYFTDLFTVDTRDGTIAQITDNWGGSTPTSAPDMAPNGALIAAVIQPGQDPPPRSIHLVSTNGMEVTNIRPWSQIDASPRWSRDGQYIVFASGTYTMHHLWIMRADGSDPVQLTQGDANDVQPDIK